MKKSRSGRNEKHHKSKSVKIFEPEKSEQPVTPDSSGQGVDDDEYGFGGWLKSSEGIEMMKLFVIGNSIVVFTTISWPCLQTVYQIITDWINGDEDLF